MRSACKFSSNKNSLPGKQAGQVLEMVTHGFMDIQTFDQGP